MAFGITRSELQRWKQEVKRGEIAFLTHYWQDKRFPDYYTVTKVGCIHIAKLTKWGEQYGLKPNWIHKDPHYPHFDLLGDKQKEILLRENLKDHLIQFNLLNSKKLS